MKSNKWMILLCMFITFGLSAQQLDRRQGEILIRVKEGLDPSRLETTHQEFNNRATDIQVSQITSSPLNIWMISFNHNEINEYNFLREINQEDEVEGISFNYVARERAVPNDTRFFQQWQYINDGSSGGIAGIDTDADIAWDLTTGGLTANGDTIVICVIDNGVDIDHEDLADNMWINYAEIPGNDIDDDSNGYIDDVYGWDAINNDGDVTRNGDHGTQVVGLVGAVGNNSLGVTGVNWNIKVMNVRGGSTVADGIRSYSYVYAQRKLYNDSGGEEGAFVVATNASWGFDRKFRDEAPLFCELYDELGFVGITNVAATSNEELDVDEEGDLPTHCTSPYLIGVTNLSKSGSKVNGSAYSIKSIDVASPGDAIITTIRNDNYSSFTGTSGAAPLVAGSLALMYATPCGVLAELNRDGWGEGALLAKDILLGSVTQNEKITDLVLTGGHLNIGNAINIVEELCNPCAPPMQVGVEVNDDRAEISWNRTGSGTDLRYRRVGELAWNTASSTNSPLMIDQLDNCARYELQFRSKCGDNGPYSHSYYFFTDNCCRNPESIQITNEDDDLTISWENISVASEYRLEYKKFNEMTWSHVLTTDPSFTFKNLNSCSAYDFRVKTMCGDDLPFTRSVNGSVNCDQCGDQSYCQIDLLDNSFEYIKSIKIDSILIETGINVKGYVPNLGYSGIVMSQGKMVEVSIEPGFIGGAFSEYMAIYVDWNQDGIFDEGERTFSPEASSETVTGMIEVPMDAFQGLTRMRVILSYDDITGTCTEDGLQFGEVEDYCVTINASAECDQSIIIESFNTTSTSIELIWTDIGTATDFTVEYRQQGNSDWVSETFITSSGIIEGLEKNRNYEFRVKANCDGVTSDFSDIVVVKTRLGTSTFDPEGVVNGYRFMPNPFAERLQVEIDLNQTVRQCSVSVYDIQGKELWNENIIVDRGMIHLNQLSGLGSGVYLIQIRGEKFTITEKVIKL